MARRLALTLEVTGALILAVVVAGVIFAWVFDANEYRNEVAAAVGQATGLVVAIDGPLHFALTPFPTMVASDLRVANPPWAVRSEMMRIGQVEVGFSPLDLLARRNRLVRLVLIRADIHLEADGHGRANWWQEVPPGQGPYPPPDIEHLELRDSRIDFVDDASRWGLQFGIENVAAQLPRDGPFTAFVRGRYGETPFEGWLEGGRYADLVGDRPLWPAVVRLQGAGARLEARGTLDRPVTEQMADFAVTLSGTRLSALASVLGAVAPPIGPYTVSGQLVGGWSHYRLGNVQAQVGGSDASGDLMVVLSPPHPRLEGHLRAHRVRPVDVFPMDVSGPGAAVPQRPPPGEGPVVDARPLPFAALSAVDFHLDVKIARLATTPLEIRDIDSTLDLTNGRLTIQPLRARIAGGRIELSLEADAGRQPPSLHVAGRGDGLMAEEVLPALGMTLSPSGPFSLALDLAGSGPSLHSFLGHADGQMRLVIGPGMLPVRQFDLIASDLVQAIMPWATRHGDRTELNCLVARFKIKDGLAAVERLLIDTTRITVTGLGTINLNTEELDLKLDPRPKDPSLISLATRMRLSGSFTDYHAAPDALGLAKGAAAGVALAIGELNPLALMLPFVSIGTGVANPCQDEIADRTPVTAVPSAPSAPSEGTTSPGGSPGGPLGGFRGLLDSVGRVMTFPAEQR